MLGGGVTASHDFITWPDPEGHLLPAATHKFTQPQTTSVLETPAGEGGSGGRVVILTITEVLMSQDFLKQVPGENVIPA